MIGTTKATTEATIDDRRAALAHHEQNDDAVRAGARPLRAKLVVTRAVRFMDEELTRTQDRGKALARGAFFLPESTPDEVAALFDAPGAVARVRATLPMLEASEAEQDAKEAETWALVVAAREALYAALADETRRQWRAFVPILASAAEAFYAVLSRAPRGHPDGHDLTEIAQLENQVRGVAVRLARRVNPAPEPKVLRGRDGLPLRAGRVLLRLLQRARDENVIFAAGARIDVTADKARDLLKRKLAEPVTQ